MHLKAVWSSKGRTFILFSSACWVKELNQNSLFGLGPKELKSAQTEMRESSSAGRAEIDKPAAKLTENLVLPTAMQPL